jgi:2-dehydropantoate 2-reductase
MSILFYGAGAIGSNLAGWLSEHYDPVYLLARGENANAIKSRGLILYKLERKNSRNIPIKVITDLNEIKSPDFVVITVKNYDLEEVAQDIHNKLGDKPIVIGLQNGIENQKILPKYFSKVVFGVIMFSGWYDEPGIFGNRGKGEIILGTPTNERQDIMEKVKDIFILGFPTKISKRFNDTVHSKLILNNANSIFTLIDNHNLTDKKRYKIAQLFIYTFLEGIEVLKKAGYKEYRLKGFPPWKILKLAKKIGKGILLRAFSNSIKYAWFNSMAQDMVIRKRGKSEIDSLTGYFIELADKNGVDVPINKTLYKLCKQEFVKVPFEPLDVDVIIKMINENLKEKMNL